MDMMIKRNEMHWVKNKLFQPY